MLLRIQYYLALVVPLLVYSITAWEYTLDNASQLNITILRPTNCHYLENQDENCRGQSVIPEGATRNTSGFWAHCSSTPVCEFVFYRTSSWTLLQASIDVFHHGESRLRVEARFYDGTQVYSFQSTDSWQRHVINDTLFAALLTANSIHFSTPYSVEDNSFVAIDKFVIQLVDGPSTTTTPGTSTSEIISPNPTSTDQTTYSTVDTTTKEVSTDISTTELITSSFHPCIFQTAEIQNTGLNNFLSLAFMNFGNWLSEQGLDPTLPITSPANVVVNTTFLRFNGTFRHTIAFGMTLDTRIFSPESDFLTPQFSFRLEMSNLTLYGIYVADGTIISMYPLAGSGVWTLSHFNLDLYFHIEGFSIENGYINVNTFDTRTINLYSNVTNAPLTMPDFIEPEDADGLGQEVLDILKNVIPNELHTQDRHPVANLVIDYLNKIFSETPLTDIIETTMPPCQTV